MCSDSLDEKFVGRIQDKTNIIIEYGSGNQNVKKMSSFTDLTACRYIRRSQVKQSGSIPFCLAIHTLVGNRRAAARSEPNDPIHIVHCDTAVPAFAPMSAGVGYLLYLGTKASILRQRWYIPT